jgi:two-component system LytT family sensor kinase
VLAKSEWNNEPPEQTHVGRLLLGLAAGVVALTILFAATQVGRLTASGVPIGWGHALTDYLIHWTTWALLSVIAFPVMARYRLDGGRLPVRLAIWVGLAVLLSLMHGLASTVLLRKLGIIPAVRLRVRGVPTSGTVAVGLWSGFTQTFAGNMVTFGLVAGVVHATLYYRDLRAHHVRELELQSRLARAELDVMRSQLQPHFLFNALHTVSALMLSDVIAARRVLVALGDLLRLAIDGNSRQEVTLQEELDFVARYVEIQHARFKDRLTVHFDVADGIGNALVPGIVLQPLVENAIHHGIEKRVDAGEVWISAQRDGARVILSVRDNGQEDARTRLPPTAGLPAEDGLRVASRGKAGLGLANITGRLKHLYGDAHEFQTCRIPGGGFEVSISLPFHIESSAAPPFPTTT